MTIWSEKISDEELKNICLIAISKGWSKDHTYHRLKADRKKIGDERLRRMWKQCGGPIQARYYG